MLEKNPTIVNFPTQNVAFGDLISEKDNKYQSKKAKSRLYDLFVNIAYESKSSSHEQQDNNNNAFSNLKKQSAITNAINVQKATKLPPVAFQSSGERSSFGSTTTELYGNNQILGAPVGTKNVDLKAKNESGVTVLPLGGQYVMHVRDPSTNQWYRICDLDVQPIIPQLIPLSESYLQIWKLK
ncbi:U4/U6.U5 tri-snRNP-associated protein 2 [Zancudomyces culisetae]|uniref:U4/U6.U5 tri-snRNP-associated protein 2 n=1 Tax=Zancudomyces culisetae TaxID=1213189 RepID=A0A1R1PVV5_ZANCU|nr:U4/U6.U5 tri-snRNP-associated protein 2 [Zancudomyces culisetae]OMH85411.1 U4/U6.U5 tri-snRNP-associated protein 2 [Zancudomyces culisetae]|eukprot:OMH85064.1 U4/U6.U5 tri-snRNP-associated protein 2 [Zancudomyces culisetae]